MAETKNQTKSAKSVALNLPSVEDLIKAGAHVGHRKTKLNPKMSAFILKQKDGVLLLDMEKTLTGLKKALEFIVQVIQDGGQVLFVSAKPPVKNLVEEMAREVEMPFVVERWLGGTLTNLKTILKRLEYFRNQEDKKKSDEFSGYTKKERLMIEKELDKLEHKMGGLKKMEKMPRAIFVLGVKESQVALREANAVGVPVIALCDVNADPEKVDYVIPASDDSLAALKLILEKVKDVILKAK